MDKRGTRRVTLVVWYTDGVVMSYPHSSRIAAERTLQNLIASTGMVYEGAVFSGMYHAERAANAVKTWQSAVTK